MKTPQTRGFTLVEVVAGLLLLATLGVSTLLAVSRHHRQTQLAQRRIQAAVIADQMLSQWYATSTGLPLTATGKINGTANWQYVVGPIDQKTVVGQGVQVVRFEINDGQQVLCSLELLRKMQLEGSPR